MRHFILGCAAAAVLWPAVAGAASPASEKMAHQVADTLRQSGELENYRVGVKYEDGVAWLLGSVTSQDQAATAVRLTKEIAGIEHVVNKLEIAPANKSEKKQASPKNDQDLMLAMLQEKAPQELPPIPSAKPAPQPQQASAPRGMPRPIQQAGLQQNVMQSGCYSNGQMGGGMSAPQGYSTGGGTGTSYDSANMPNYAWPSYAAHPNYAALSYPKQYSPAAWPYIGPFHPYPQVPLGWRKVTLEWDDGWWFLDFSHHKGH